MDDAEELDRLVDPVHQVARRALPGEPLRGALKGAPLGHPLHPVLTDLPIGFWTSSFVLDLIPTAWARRSADVMVGLGVLSALPTMWTGVADWVDLDRRTRRSGTVHAAANLTATALYAASYSRRRQGRRFSGVALAMVGAAAATAGGFLGGHLAFGDAELPAEDDGPTHG